MINFVQETKLEIAKRTFRPLKQTDPWGGCLFTLWQDIAPILAIFLLTSRHSVDFWWTPDLKQRLLRMITRCWKGFPSFWLHYDRGSHCPKFEDGEGPTLEGATIWGVDPGAKVHFVSVNGHDVAVNADMPFSTREPYRVRSTSTREYYHLCEIPQATWKRAS